MLSATVNMRRAVVSPFGPVLLVLAACGGSNNPPAPGGSSGGGDTITGRERIGWTQSAESAADLAMYRYALYIDNQRRIVEGETCTPAGESSVECSAALPTLGAGRHSLEVAAFFTIGDTVYEGPRSGALQVTVVGTTAASTGQVVQGGTFTSAEGVTLHADILSRDLREPVDLAVAADGRVFVAERAGRLRVIADDRVADTTADNLLGALGEGPDTHATLSSIALTPDFDASRMLYVTMIASDRERPSVRLVRWRELAGVVGQPATVATYPVSDLETSSIVRLGPDGLIYLGIGAGSNADAAQDLGAPEGKILRLNPDGTTPGDNPAGSPVLSLGHHDPRGLAWTLPVRSLWQLDRDERGDELNQVHRGANFGWPIVRERADHPGITAPAVTLTAGSDASGLAAVVAQDNPFAGDLIVASAGQRDLLRFRPASDGRVRLVDRLLQGRYGRIAQIVSGPDGALYFVTANQDEWGEAQDVLVRVRVRARSPRPRRD